MNYNNFIEFCTYYIVKTKRKTCKSFSKILPTYATSLRRPAFFDAELYTRVYKQKYKSQIHV